MSEDTSPVSALDILGADLSGVDTDFPILEAGVVDFIVSDMKIEPTKDRQGSLVNITLKTTIPWKVRPDKAGEQAVKAPGFPLRSRIFVPGPGAKPEAITVAKQKLAQFKEAVTGSKAGSFGAAEQYIGRPVSARIKIEIDKDGQYPDKNEVAAWVRRNV